MFFSECYSDHGTINIPQIASKIFVTQCFFADHLNHKIATKIICRTLSANHFLTMDTLIEKLCNYVFRLSGFPDLSGEVFFITFKFS